jgi:hypothetical protein
MAGSSSQLAILFDYSQLDASGPRKLVQLFPANGVQRTLIESTDASLRMAALGDRLFVQRSLSLLVFEPEGQGPVLLRDDLQHWYMAGIIPPYAISYDAWYENDLLALDFSGGAAATLSTHAALWDGVDVSGSDIYWATRRLPDLVTGDVWVQAFAGGP